MRTANPALHGDTFNIVNTTGNVMTISGTVNKTAILLAFAVASGYWSWHVYLNDAANQTNNAFPLMIGGAIGGFIAAMVTIFKKQWAPITAPIYALLEGLFLGGISAIYNAQFKGIVVQAVALTLGVLAVLLVAYKSGLIKPTENMKLMYMYIDVYVYINHIASADMAYHICHYLFMLRIVYIQLSYIG